MVLHDIVDFWKIIFLDDRMKTLPQKELILIKTELENRIKKLQYNNIRYSENFTLELKNDVSFEISEKLPAGIPTRRSIDDVRRTCIKLAKDKNVNVLMQLLLTATESGSNVSIWYQATCIDGMPTLSKAKAYEDDGVYYNDILHHDEVDLFFIEEYLFDEINDNMDGSPWGEIDDDGNYADQERYDRMYAHYMNIFFPSMLREDDNFDYSYFKKYLND